MNMKERIALVVAVLALVPLISSGIAYAYCPSYNQDAYYDCTLVPDWYCGWCVYAECWPPNGVGPPATDGVCTTGDYGCSFVCWIYGGCCAY